jgi:adenylyltransferase/sulfurtransferase
MKSQDDASERRDPVVAPEGPPALEISIREARELLSRDTRTLLIDLRGEGELCLGHIEGARMVPPGLLEQEIGRLAKDKETPVLVYCATGKIALRAVERLRKMGFANARSIAGGYNAWLDAGAPIAAEGVFTPAQLDRYSRNMLLTEIGQEGQMRLMQARVLLVGAGGLASSAALYLAGAGVGTIGLVDFDKVSLSNLNRQVIHGTNDVGRPKVDSAKSAIERLNPDVSVVTYRELFTPENALEIVEDFDVVMDASDNIGTKFLTHDASYLAGKPYIFGGAVQFDGQACVFWPKKSGPCLRCIFPVPPAQNLTPSCSQVGVLGMVPGHIGLIQATEAVKLILGIGTPMIGKFYIYNALSLSASFIDIGRRPGCELCGEYPTIRTLTGEGSVDYEMNVCELGY